LTHLEAANQQLTNEKAALNKEASKVQGLNNDLAAAKAATVSAEAKFAVCAQEKAAIQQIANRVAGLEGQLRDEKAVKAKAEALAAKLQGENTAIQATNSTCQAQLAKVNAEKTALLAEIAKLTGEVTAAAQGLDIASMSPPADVPGGGTRSHSRAHSRRRRRN
jgi:chromosome segregation ATPase